VESAAELATTVPAAAADPVVSLPPTYFVGGSVAAAALLIAVGQATPLPVWLLAVEVLLTILGLFLFGSFKY